MLGVVRLPRQCPPSKIHPLPLGPSALSLTFAVLCCPVLCWTVSYQSLRLSLPTSLSRHALYQAFPRHSLPGSQQLAHDAPRLTKIHPRKTPKHNRIGFESNLRDSLAARSTSFLASLHDSGWDCFLAILSALRRGAIVLTPALERYHYNRSPSSLTGTNRAPYIQSSV